MSMEAPSKADSGAATRVISRSDWGGGMKVMAMGAERRELLSVNTPS